LKFESSLAGLIALLLNMGDVR